MSEIGAFEAKTHLPRLLKRVQAGGTLRHHQAQPPLRRVDPVQDARRLQDPGPRSTT